MARHGKAYLTGYDLVAVAAEARVVEIANIDEKHRRLEAVPVIDEIGQRPGKILAGPLEGDAAGVVAALHGQIVAASECGDQ